MDEEMTRRSLLASAFAFAGCGRRRGSGFPGFAFIANREGRAIAAVDLTAFAVARHIRLASPPTSVVANPRRSLVYALTPGSGELHEVDVATLKVSRKVRVGREAHSMRLDPDSESMWVACTNPRQLVRVPLDSLHAGPGIPLRADPVDFDIARDGSAAAVAFGAAGSVAVLDLGGGSSHTAAAGIHVSHVQFRSDGRVLLAGDAGSRSILVLEPGTGRTVVNLPIAVRPDHFCVKADGGQFFVTGEGMDAVVIVYPYSTEIAETVLAGRSPGPMAECTGSNYLFIANTSSGEVSVLDIETRRVLAIVPVGREPACIGLTPDQQYALVLNRASGDIAIIRVASIAAKRTKSAPLFTMIPVGSGPVSIAVRQV